VIPILSVARGPQASISVMAITFFAFLVFFAS
jgi:hypothetical protein